MGVMNKYGNMSYLFWMARDSGISKKIKANHVITRNS